MHDGNALNKIFLIIIVTVLAGYLTLEMRSLRLSVPPPVLDDIDFHEGNPVSRELHSWTRNGAAVDEAAVLMYLNARIKQYDVPGGVYIRENGINGGNAIVLRDESDTWIYWADGMLQECVSRLGERPDVTGGRIIMALDSFYTVPNEDGGITNTVTYTRNGKRQTLSGIVYLRSAPK